MKSLRGAILFWMALLLLIVGAVSAVATFEYVKEETQSAFDAEIRQVALFLQNETAGYVPPRDALTAADPDNPFLIQIWNAQGQLIRTSDISVSSAVPLSTGFATENLGQTGWRSYSIVGPLQSIRVGLPLDERNEQAPTAAMQIIIPMVLIIPLSWLLLSLLIDRILAGLKKASTRVRNRKADDQSQISLSDVPREIIPFVESINRHVARVHAQSERQKRFLSDAAHELRTPLTAIAIQLANLKTVLRTKDQAQRLAAAEGGSRRANLLVSRLLDLARYDSPTLLPEDRTEKLSKILNDVIIGLGPQSTSKNLKVQFKPNLVYDAALPAGALSQVCEILLDNAIRYSLPNSVIEIKTDGDHNKFGIYISDQGPGIDPAKLHLVFERFYRAEPHQSEGTGLGLSIAKTICDSRGWKIQLRNREGGKGVEAIISGKLAMP